MEQKKCFILNKIFEGDWNDKEGNISHEIINFFQTDKGRLFAYNEPYGSLPNDIFCSQDGFKGNSKYLAEYLLLTSRTKNKKFYIQYRIKLKKRLHILKYVRDKGSAEWQNNKGEISKIVNDEDICYGGVSLDTIFSDNFDCLLVTFEAEKIEIPEQPIYIDNLKYNFQRNKGYIRSDKYEDANQITDYKRIEEKLNSTKWIDYNPQGILYEDVSSLSKTKKTFLDLILKVNSEECYTNILYSILNYKDFLTRFLNKFKMANSKISTKKFDVKRETGIVNGRMDICAESEDQRIVIENKVHSGLNGFEVIEEDIDRKNDNEVIENEDNSKTQLAKYFIWANVKNDQNGNFNPVCFITCPDYHRSEIENEIKAKDTSMISKYILVKYSQIVEFIIDNINDIDEDYEFFDYKNDLVEIFKKHSQESKKEKITTDFKLAINKKMR